MADRAEIARRVEIVAAVVGDLASVLDSLARALRDPPAEPDPTPAAPPPPSTPPSGAAARRGGELPPAAERAYKVLAFDAEGQPIALCHDIRAVLFDARPPSLTANEVMARVNAFQALIKFLDARLPGGSVEDAWAALQALNQQTQWLMAAGMINRDRLAEYLWERVGSSSDNPEAPSPPPGSAPAVSAPPPVPGDTCG
jgi:hypothetical protein